LSLVIRLFLGANNEMNGPVHIFGLCLPANVFLVRFNCFPYKVYGRMCLYDMISAPIILFLPSVNGAVCGVWTKVWADRRKVLVLNG
jgi:hypothetical protein